MTLEEATKQFGIDNYVVISKDALLYQDEIIEGSQIAFPDTMQKQIDDGEFIMFIRADKV